MKEENILEFLNYRHACKVFDPEKKVKQEHFNLILEAARLSPSSFGFEPWNFVVIQDKKIREKMLPIVWGAQNTLKTATYFVAILARKRVSLLYNSKYIDKMLYNVHKIPKEQAEARREKYKKFQEEDFNLLQSDRAINDWASKQTYIALANMMSVAAMLKVDSCAIEGYDFEKTNNLLSKELGYSKDEFALSVMVAFGHRASEPKAKTRQSLEDIVKYI
jgi:nitroreductase